MESVYCIFKPSSSVSIVALKAFFNSSSDIDNEKSVFDSLT